MQETKEGLHELQTEMVELMKKTGVSEKHIPYIDVIPVEDYDRWYNKEATPHTNDKYILACVENGAVQAATSLNRSAQSKLHAACFMYYNL